MTLKSLPLALMATALLAGCDAGNQRVAYVGDGDNWQQVSLKEAAQFKALQQGIEAKPELVAAVARNPDEAEVLAQLNAKDPGDWTEEDFANMSVIIAKDVCNIPDGQVITPTTTCNF
ncbi:alpha-ketoglutarate decarboxylase [Roseobacter sp. SK209-2-6]|uniref:hypothetical protein n=1 Tax=Roseobacter sp. SK209-2-6 TaxID=388739 RepID=UPI0000F3D21A|nr:hypothetical protein [Roseobacter sp. SK209-2-6]EBA15032.1 alpha-ketoglutarate decarboxylase [Roseobacter sp. SK209-2-6]